MDPGPHVQEPVPGSLIEILRQGLRSSGQSPELGGGRPGSLYFMPTTSQSLLLGDARPAWGAGCPA